jgi:signal transduction histidine kinase
VGPPRQWTSEEIAFAASVADNISRLYEEAARHDAESSLQAYEAHMLELHRMEAIGRMAAGIAHDFRGVLGAALGHAQLILRTPQLPGNVENNARHIVDAIERGQKLAQEVTSFAHDRPMSPRILDVQTLINSLAPMLRALLGHGYQLTLEFKEPLGLIFMDPTQLERAILNLVLNARDAMPLGGEIKIKAEECARDDVLFTAVSVSDSGIGMDAATVNDALKPFFTTKGDSGTGLGLAIVDQVLTRAGGALSIESEVGKGTTMHLYLPRIAVDSKTVAA